jgi:hypothetical protein
MKRALIILASLTLVTASAFAQVHHGNELNPAAGQQQGDNEGDNGVSNKAAPGGSGNLINHGGPVMPFAKVVCIFWGSSLSSGSSYVSEMRSFRTSFYGMVSHTGMLNQYGAQQNNFAGSQADIFDSSNPPSARVTDSMVQAEVKKWFNGRYDTNAVYEVFIPNGYYSDDGTGANSCGGPNLQYCAYHSSGDGVNLPTNVKYSIEPYPSCSGCSAAGFNTNQNAEHFMVHETRETVTDPFGSTWYDRVGYEADDKCAWISLFTERAADGHTYGYQPEYSNSARNCVK